MTELGKRDKCRDILTLYYKINNPQRWCRDILTLYYKVKNILTFFFVLLSFTTLFQEKFSEKIQEMVGFVFSWSKPNGEMTHGLKYCINRFKVLKLFISWRFFNIYSIFYLFQQKPSLLRTASNQGKIVWKIYSDSTKSLTQFSQTPWFYNDTAVLYHELCLVGTIRF